LAPAQVCPQWTQTLARHESQTMGTTRRIQQKRIDHQNQGGIMTNINTDIEPFGVVTKQYQINMAANRMAEALAMLLIDITNGYNEGTLRRPKQSIVVEALWALTSYETVTEGGKS
jgi:hypothetical protein